VLVQAPLPTSQGTGIVGKARSWQRADSESCRISRNPSEQLCSAIAWKYSTCFKTVDPGNQTHQLMVLTIGIVAQTTS
jgi:hypothetical protein